MKILVANLGSTSFKYRLYDLGDPAEPLLARGAVERIGSDQAKVTMRSPKGEAEEVIALPDHAAAVRLCLEQLTSPTLGVLASADEVNAIGFKAVHAKGMTGVHRVDPRVLAAMEAYSSVCPAHNPPYINAMRLLGERLPDLPLIAAFETGFHRTAPEASQRYAIPDEWTHTHGIKRWGFHGASHRYIAGRIAAVMGRNNLKVVSCHLGGSSSLCAIQNGKSRGASMGMSPQTGIPQNNRVGDFDVFALPVLIAAGLTLDEILDTLANRSGLLGVGGSGNDLRDIEAAAGSGHVRANLAMDVFINSIRHSLGAYLVDLGGADAIVFTGGIGENSVKVREAVCGNLEWAGIVLDPAKNAAAKGECVVSADSSRVQVWCLPTNEEIVVARQARDLLASGKDAIEDDLDGHA